MRKFRTTHILAAGVVTPALTGLPQHAAARSVDVPGDIETSSPNVASASDDEATRAHLLEVLLSLSPAEKRAIAGDRIRNNMPRVRMADKSPTAASCGAHCLKGAKAINGTCTAQSNRETQPAVRTRTLPPPPPPPPPKVK